MSRFKLSKHPIAADAPNRQPDVEINMSQIRPKTGQAMVDALKPRALGGKPSDLKNEPSDIPSSLKVGMHRVAFAVQTLKTHVDSSSYLDLIESEYARLIATSKPFSKKVSLSMFTYYASVRLQRKFLEVSVAAYESDEETLLSFFSLLPDLGSQYHNG